MACTATDTPLDPSSDIPTAALEPSTPVPGGSCPTGTTQTSGEIPVTGGYYLICVPDAGWNGNLVVYAPGYVNPQAPLQIRDDGIEGRPVSQIITGLGFAFATTSYRSNGLVVPEGTDDLQQVVSIFRQAYGTVEGSVYAVGASEGGLIVTLATERHPQLFDGTLALCGPVGSFAGQVRYLGDVRVLFDYFFPGVIPGDLVNVPAEATMAFGTAAQPGPLAVAILQAMERNPLATFLFLQAARIIVPPSQVGPTVLTLLAYDILGYTQIEAVLGGNPYDNTGTVYPFPVRNSRVDRYVADPPAVSRIRAAYETSGRLGVPVVTLHNLLDPIVPYRQVLLYGQKVGAAGSGDRLTQLTAANPFGHCNFTLVEVQTAFQRLITEAAPQVQVATR